MNISVIGTGYVGLVTGTCFAELGNTVTCIDIDSEKISLLKRGVAPFYEPGLEELLKRNQQALRLSFTTSFGDISSSTIIFIAVGTPSRPNGDVDLSYVEKVAATIAMHLKQYAVIVNKSTVPVGTGDFVRAIIKKTYSGEFDVVSNPEFLREGSAIEDCLHPDRIVIGTTNHKALVLIQELYKPFNCPLVITNIKTAEIIKYASNAFLATSISFINQISQLCEEVGANVEEVAHGMKLDKRIGKQAFLRAGIGYGGSCFPKDVKGLLQSLKKHRCSLGILEAVETINYTQQQLFLQKINKLFPLLQDKKIAIWGLSFKPKTDDLRDAPSVTIIPALQQAGANIVAYDPVAMHNAKKIFKKVTYAKTATDALTGSDCLVILTDWDEFKQVDKRELKKRLTQPIIIDGRNIYDPEEMKKNGFTYVSIGR